MRPYHVLYLALAATPAAAQTPPDAMPTSPAAVMPHMPMPQRFAAANTSHDGRLTLAQAQAARWRRITRHFAEMDQGSKGFVTIDDIRAFNRAHHAAKQTEAPPR